MILFIDFEVYFLLFFCYCYIKGVFWVSGSFIVVSSVIIMVYFLLLLNI